MLAENFIDNDQDKLRGRKIVKMRVKNRNTLMLTVPDGNVIGPGESEILVYEDRVKHVLAMVEDEPESLIAAQADFELEVAREVMHAMGEFKGTVAEMRAAIKAKKDKAINEAYQKALQETAASVQGAFLQKVGRDIKPLESAVLIENSAEMEPRRKREIEQAREAAEMLRVEPVKSEAFNQAVREEVQRIMREQKGQRG